MPSAFRRGDERGKRVGGHHGAGRIGGAREQHAGERARAVCGDHIGGGQRPAIARRNLDRHRLAAERREDVAVRRIARTGDGDPVARLEHGEKGEHEARRGAGRDDDAAGIEVDAVALAVMGGDARAQRRDAERLGVADRPPEGGLRGGACARRRRRRRLADLHVDDPAPRRLEPRRPRHHVHHDESGHVAAQRGRHQPPCQIKHELHTPSPA